jgi:hypothetical protein
VANNLAIVNESLAKQTTVTLRAGDKDGEVDAVVDVIDENPRKIFASLDNTGTPSTGYYRLGIGYQHGNLNDRDSAMDAAVHHLARPRQGSRHLQCELPPAVVPLQRLDGFHPGLFRRQCRNDANHRRASRVYGPGRHHERAFQPASGPDRRLRPQAGVGDRPP